jgi:hypothetical protein
VPAIVGIGLQASPETATAKSSTEPLWASESLRGGSLQPIGLRTSLLTARCLRAWSWITYVVTADACILATCESVRRGRMQFVVRSINPRLVPSGEMQGPQREADDVSIMVRITDLIVTMRRSEDSNPSSHPGFGSTGGPDPSHRKWSLQPTRIASAASRDRDRLSPDCPGVAGCR